ncbi:protein [Lentinula edodes]|uniref:Protein n=1 Tax=Lentinula edodes TaxID=5353 RepID=A0A1Q3EJY4_LENED|nr:protein [Lentinula edodes]
MPASVGTVKSLGASSYILQKNFSFSIALFHADPDLSVGNTSLVPLPSNDFLLFTTLITALLRTLIAAVISTLIFRDPWIYAAGAAPPIDLAVALFAATHGHRNRKKQRQERPPKTADEIGAHPTPVSRFVPDATAVRASFSLASDAPVASTSYVGLHDDGEEGERRTWSLKELVGPRSLHQFSLIEAVPGTTVPIADAERRVIALVVYPDDAGILKCAEEAAELIREEGKKASFASKHVNGRRGDFAALNAGVAHGGGRVKPANIVHNEVNRNVLNRLVTSGPFQRLSGYATGSSLY